MTAKLSFSALPLLVTGLPRTLQSWLRTSGIPMVAYRSGSSFQAFLNESRGRFLLFDSRNPRSRAEAETAEKSGREIIDVAPNGLLDSQGYSSQHPFRYEELSAHDWILLLHEELKQRQGVWMRVHDLPAPYDAIIFTDGLPHQPELRLVAESLSVIHGSHVKPVSEAGFAVDHVFFGEESTDGNQFGCWWTTDPRRRGKTILQENDPTIWRANSRQFAEWWAFRQTLTSVVDQTEDQLRIVTSTLDQDRWTPMAELWRKGHVARFPLTHSLLTLNRSTMVYGLDRFRHSAGLFLSQGHPMPTAPPVSVSA